MFYKIQCNPASITSPDTEYFINPMQVQVIKPIFDRDSKSNKTSTIIGSSMRFDEDLTLFTKLKPEELKDMFSK